MLEYAFMQNALLVSVLISLMCPMIGMFLVLRRYSMIGDTWLENKKMKFKDHISDFIQLMEDIKKMDLPVKVTYGLEVCYVPQHEEYIRKVLSQYHFDFIVGAIHSIDGILYDMSFSKELLWDKYDVNQIGRAHV